MLEILKKEVIKAAQDGQRLDLCKHKSGNFSIRDKETGYVVVTPSGVNREELTVDDICVLTVDGETMMHLEVYKTREDIMAIVHTHSKMATSFAVLNKPIPAIIYEVATFGLKDAVVPVAPYARPGTVELAKSVIEPVKRADIFLLEKHGVVACGTDMYEAFLRAQYVEELAEVYYYTLLINKGNEPDSFSSEELESWKYPEKLEKN